MDALKHRAAKSRFCMYVTLVYRYVFCLVIEFVILKLIIYSLKFKDVVLFVD